MVDAGAEPTYEEKIRVPPPPLGATPPLTGPPIHNKPISDPV